MHYTFSVIVQIEKNYIKMSNNNFFLTMIVLTFTCISSRHLLFFSEATNLQRKVSLISHPTTTVLTPTPTQQFGNKTDKPKSLSSHLSMAAESGLTFISVFIFGCVIIGLFEKKLPWFCAWLITLNHVFHSIYLSPSES